MLYINFKKTTKKMINVLCLSLLLFAVSSILCTTEALAAGNDTGVFSALVGKGVEIFLGMREIIFAVSGFGIIAVAIGGFFGNLNWKWLTAIGIGLFVISSTAAIIDYMVGQRPGSLTDVQAGLKSGN